jgi:hypothetical protein
LFGDYVTELQGMIEKSGDGLPVAVVQFAKIKIFQGCEFFVIIKFFCLVL